MANLQKQRQATLDHDAEERLARMLAKAPTAQVVLDAVEEKVDMLDHIALTAAFGTLAKRAISVSPKVASSPVLRTLVDKATQVLQSGNFDGQLVGNIFWSLAILQKQAPVLLDLLPDLADSVVTRVSTMNAQDVANVLWAIAKLDDRSNVLHVVPLIMNRVSRVSAKANAQALSNTFWSVATLRRAAPAMVQYLPLLLADVESHADEFTSQAISNIAWAIGITNLPQSRAAMTALQKLQDRGIVVSSDMTSQQWANMCWGLALRGSADQQFMKEAAACVLTMAASTSDKAANLDLPQVAVAFARLDMRHRKLLAAIADRMFPVPKRLGDWGLCALAWSYETLGVTDRFAEFYQSLRAEIARRGIPPERVELSRLGPAEWPRRR